jgi:urease accessory protein
MSDSWALSRQPSPSVGQPDWAGWLVWQLVDASFPTGGFAHSAGLESAWRHGAVPDAEALAGFLQSSLRQWCASALPFLTAAHATPEHVLALDEDLDATLTNPVSNRASRRQGLALLSSSVSIFDSEAVGDLHRSVMQAGCGHFAVVWGALTAELGLSRLEAGRMAVFMLLRDGIGAAVRLDVVGSRAGQRLQWQLSEPAEQIVQRFLHQPVTQSAQCAPMLDIWQANHDRLNVRLFQS